MSTKKTHIWEGKAISFSYPSSPNSVKYGFPDTGCWCVELYPSIDSIIGGKNVAQFKDKAHAIAHADALPQIYTNMHKKYFNYAAK